MILARMIEEEINLALLQLNDLIDIIVCTVQVYSTVNLLFRRKNCKHYVIRVNDVRAFSSGPNLSRSPGDLDSFGTHALFECKSEFKKRWTKYI